MALASFGVSFVMQPACLGIFMRGSGTIHHYARFHLLVPHHHAGDKMDGNEGQSYQNLATPRQIFFGDTAISEGRAWRVG